MTDRSSEERSRFEKWWTAELLSGKTWTSADIDNMQLAWRAALEDRQEAAPDDCARYRHALEVIGECSKDGKSVNVAVLALYPPGVPSEATPSKEGTCPKCGSPVEAGKPPNAGRLICRQCDEWYWPYEIVPPAPEVQGTPRRTIIGFTYETRDKTFEMDEEMYKLLEGYALQGKKLEAFFEGLAAGRISEVAPVGTPQKETPPISEQVAVWRNLYPSAEFASVTAAVQGKEPQAEGLADYDIRHSYSYLSGEAAGRRSAITEIHKRALEEYSRLHSACLDYCPENQLQTVIDWCAELQEKTK